MTGFWKPIAPAALLIASVTLMAGCQTTASGGSDVSCRAFSSITWSNRDTVETVHQVRGHNAAYRSLCGR